MAVHGVFSLGAAGCDGAEDNVCIVFGSNAGICTLCLTVGITGQSLNPTMVITIPIRPVLCVSRTLLVALILGWVHPWGDGIADAVFVACGLGTTALSAASAISMT